MPFTLSHVVAILPLRRWLPPSALAAGAMVPDLPYYLPTPFTAAVTHEWPGGLLVGVPLGAALLVVFHLFLRAPLTALAPAGLRARLPDRAPVRAIAVMVALLAGVLTHLVWDGFTQVGGFAVLHWPVMREAVAGPHRVFNVVMYVSSLGGLVVLACWFALWYRRAAVRADPPAGLPGRRRAWVMTGAVTAVAAGAVIMGNSEQAAASQYDLIRWTILGGMVGCGAVLVAYALAWHISRASRPARDTTGSHT